MGRQDFEKSVLISAARSLCDCPSRSHVRKSRQCSPIVALRKPRVPSTAQQPPGQIRRRLLILHPWSPGKKLLLEPQGASVAAGPKRLTEFIFFFNLVRAGSRGGYFHLGQALNDAGSNTGLIRSHRPEFTPSLLAVVKPSQSSKHKV